MVGEMQHYIAKATALAIMSDEVTLPTPNTAELRNWYHPMKLLKTRRWPHNPRKHSCMLEVSTQKSERCTLHDRIGGYSAHMAPAATIEPPPMPKLDPPSDHRYSVNQHTDHSWTVHGI